MKQFDTKHDLFFANQRALYINRHDYNHSEEYRQEKLGYSLSTGISSYHH
jgi:hypothetical protein